MALPVLTHAISNTGGFGEFGKNCIVYLEIVSLFYFRRTYRLQRKSRCGVACEVLWHFACGEVDSEIPLPFPNVKLMQTDVTWSSGVEQ